MSVAVETVLVTGASQGIGLELARAFARDGHRLIVTGRDGAALTKAAAELRAAGAGEVITLTAELGTDEGIDGLLAEIALRRLEIDVLVNNAGFGAHGNSWELDDATERALTVVHVIAPWRLTKALLPGMLQRRRGGVLNVGSLYSFSPSPWQAVYGAAKSWVLSYSLALREELRGTGIVVTALCPGTTLSRFRERFGHRDRASWLTLTSGQVAAIGYRAFRRRRAVVVPGRVNQLYVLAARLLPTRWSGRFVYYTAYRLRGMPVASPTR
jgi:short-subunit dehydrogenase